MLCCWQPLAGVLWDGMAASAAAKASSVPAVMELTYLSNTCRYKWDSLPNAQRPEKGLLALRASLSAFANLRPAVVLPQLADASTLKREVQSWRGGSGPQLL